ncbi:MAG: TrkA family potassium uptake protein [Oscillospiraceae bacterium]|nr:TrkA family potassium uptake protein [Oscillospiraceae bacterium]
MNILIIGCGRVGSELAATLDKHGHDISIIDKDKNSFDMLPDDFSGFTTVGIPIDRDVLKRAGIESCDALCAVTGSDNMNVMAAQIAAQIFGVEKVFARIRDISKGRICEQMGIHIVCPTSLVVSSACAAMEEQGQTTSRLSFENHSVNFTTMEVPKELIGKTAHDIEYELGEMLFAVMCGSEMIFSSQNSNIVFAEGDKLVFAKKA